MTLIYCVNTLCIYVLDFGSSRFLLNSWHQNKQNIQRTSPCPRGDQASGTSHCVFLQLMGRNFQKYRPYLFWSLIFQAPSAKNFRNYILSPPSRWTVTDAGGKRRTPNKLHETYWVNRCLPPFFYLLCKLTLGHSKQKNIPYIPSAYCPLAMEKPSA